MKRSLWKNRFGLYQRRWPWRPLVYTWTLLRYYCTPHLTQFSSSAIQQIFATNSICGKASAEVMLPNAAWHELQWPVFRQLEHLQLTSFRDHLVQLRMQRVMCCSPHYAQSSVLLTSNLDSEKSSTLSCLTAFGVSWLSSFFGAGVKNVWHGVSWEKTLLLAMTYGSTN